MVLSPCKALVAASVLLLLLSEFPTAQADRATQRSKGRSEAAIRSRLSIGEDADGGDPVVDIGKVTQDQKKKVDTSLDKAAEGIRAAEKAAVAALRQAANWKVGSAKIPMLIHEVNKVAKERVWTPLAEIAPSVSQGEKQSMVSLLRGILKDIESQKTSPYVTPEDLDKALANMTNVREESTRTRLNHTAEESIPNTVEELVSALAPSTTPTALTSNPTPTRVTSTRTKEELKKEIGELSTETAVLINLKLSKSAEEWETETEQPKSKELQGRLKIAIQKKEEAEKELEEAGTHFTHCGAKTIMDIAKVDCPSDDDVVARCAADTAEVMIGGLCSAGDGCGNEGLDNCARGRDVYRIVAKDRLCTTNTIREIENTECPGELQSLPKCDSTLELDKLCAVGDTCGDHNFTTAGLLTCYRVTSVWQAPFG